MSNTQPTFQAGEAHGHSWVSPGDSANAASDKTAQAAQSTKESAQQSKDSASGFLQQTGEQMKNMAQGAVDGVKNTLGAGESNSNK